MAIRMGGKVVSEAVRNNLKEEAANLKANGVLPKLVVVIVGNDPASKVYVRNKKLGCEEIGIGSEIYELPETTTQDELMRLVEELNGREDVHGILVQSPLPKHLDEGMVIKNIDPRKDVDAFHPINVGKIMIGDFDFLPCTPAGIVELLDYYNVPIEGKHCVVIGRSNIVGKPMSMLLLHRNGTVTICHSRTENLGEITKQADILVAAVGKAGFVTADMVKDGTVVVDVGMNRNAEGKLCGDVAYDEVEAKVSHITPVPGGVGPMTITMLLKNTITAAKKKCGKA